MLDKQVCTIGCMSNSRSLPIALNSMVKIFAGFTLRGELGWHWQYQDTLPVDICIVDLDTYPDMSQLSEQQKIIAVSSSPELLKDYSYALQKPLKSQQLLALCKEFESQAGVVSSVTKIDKSVDSNVIATQSLEDDFATSPMASISSLETLYQLESWPDFSRVSEEQISDLSRLCALLALRPSTRQDILRLLSMAEAQLDTLFAVIEQHSYIGYTSLGTNFMTDSGLAVEEHTAITPPASSSSFLSKMWRKLKGGV